MSEVTDRAVSEVDGNRRHASEGRLPDDPVAYLAQAEALTNFGTADQVAQLFAPDAVFEMVTDGAVQTYRGRDEISKAWAAVANSFQPRGFRIRKSLVVAGDNVIVDDWHGQWGNGSRVRGIEVFRFNSDGQIRECELYSYLNVKPETSPIQRLRLLFNYPGVVLAVLREQRRQLKRSHAGGAT